jgi:outer membrane autotransporter protein
VAQANFDGATLRATASNAAFVTGFTGTGLNIAAGGLTVDTGSFTDTVASPFSGVGALSKAGAGTLVMTGNSGYAGGTTISAGTLQLGNGGTSGSITGDVVNNGTLVFDRSDVSTFGGAISGSGAVNQIGTGTTVLTANNTYAGGTTISAGTLQLGNGGTSGSIAGNVTNNGALVFSRSDAYTYGGQISGSGTVSQIGSGTTILTANNTYTGGTTVSAGTLAIGDAAHAQATSGSGNVSVATGATLGGYGQIAGSVQNSGTLAVANALSAFATGPTGTLRIGGSVTNNGTLALAAANGTPGNVLQIAGNYTGSGQIVLNTVANQGGAASQSDRLVIGANASGSTAIAINRSGGIGAQTVGDGIQVVQVGGTSAANSFHLAGPVQAGAYQYLLYQGGSADANSWYLRSQLEAAAGAIAGANGPSSSTVALSAVAYRPAVVGYALSPLLNADYGFTLLGRTQQRVGDEHSAEAAQPAHSNGVWGRIGGQGLDANAGSRFVADERTFFAQFGKDWTVGRDPSGGSTHAGAMVTFGSNSASFSDTLRSITGQLSNATGTVETQSQSLGGYWTRYLPDGTYIDAVGQLTHYHNRYSDVFADSASQNGFGAGVAGEIGKPFALGASGAAIEPQAQLLYQYLHLNGFNDGISEVGANSTNSLRGRVGFRLFKADLSNDSKTSSVTPWFTADLLRDFFAPGRTNVGGTVFDNALGRTWYELGLGISGSFGKHAAVFADVRYARNLGGDYRRTVSGQAGYRYSW